ncbi:MAG: 50S ribosomal protein L6 [Holophagales bacterium]|nr:50S ribosomal protein L6 [Holophagales bacterium]
MSRVGKQPISVPGAAKVKVDGDLFTAEGPKGKVEVRIFPGDCPVKIEDGTITVGRNGNSGNMRAKHGLTRALLANAVHGVTEGFAKELEIVGVGYRGEVKGKECHFALGFSHPVVYAIPEGISIEIDGKANKVKIAGADRQQVGQVAAEIRSLRPPDPYKAKGIRYSGEHIRRKVGKAGAR